MVPRPGVEPGELRLEISAASIARGLVPTNGNDPLSPRLQLGANPSQLHRRCLEEGHGVEPSAFPPAQFSRLVAVHTARPSVEQGPLAPGLSSPSIGYGSGRPASMASTIDVGTL